MAAASGEVDLAAQAMDLAALARERQARAGNATDKSKKPTQKTTSSSNSDGGVGSTQKALLVVAAVFIGPAILKGVYDKVTTEKVDISDLNVVTSYETPAIEMMDDTVRIQFCAS